MTALRTIIALGFGIPEAIFLYHAAFQDNINAGYWAFGLAVASTLVSLMVTLVAGDEDGPFTKIFSFIVGVAYYVVLVLGVFQHNTTFLTWAFWAELAGIALLILMTFVAGLVFMAVEA